MYSQWKSSVGTISGQVWSSNFWYTWCSTEQYQIKIKFIATLIANHPHWWRDSKGKKSKATHNNDLTFHANFTIHFVIQVEFLQLEVLVTSVESMMLPKRLVYWPLLANLIVENLIFVPNKNWEYQMSNRYSITSHHDPTDTFRVQYFQPNYLPDNILQHFKPSSGIYVRYHGQIYLWLCKMVFYYTTKRINSRRRKIFLNQITMTNVLLTGITYEFIK